jgi:hypothetical protein
MSDIYPPTVQRPALLKLRDALGCRENALRRDECGDWRVKGRQGQIYAVPEGFQLCYFARNGVSEFDGEGPHLEDYAKAKRELVFCRLVQDGTGEGIFFLDRLPTPTEAEVIRETLVISKKRDTSDPSDAQRAAWAALANRSRANVSETTCTDDRDPQDRAAGAGVAQDGFPPGLDGQSVPETLRR